MIQVERTTTARPAEVWRLLSDVEHWDRLLPTVDRVTRVGGAGPVGVGSRFQVRQPGLRPAVYEVTEWQAGRSFVWVSSQRGVVTTATHDVTEADGVTRLELGIRWTGALAGLVRLAFGTKTRRMVQHEADTFAQLAERDAAA